MPNSKVAVEAIIREAWAAGDFPATFMLLPTIYGPGDSLAREWSFVKRMLDDRRRIALPDGGLGFFHRGYMDDMAHAVTLALESPQAIGRTYKVGYERVLTMRGGALRWWHG